MFVTLFPNYKTHREQPASARRSDSSQALPLPASPSSLRLGCQSLIASETAAYSPKVPKDGGREERRSGGWGTVVSSWQLPAFDLHKGKEGAGGGNGYDLFSKFLTAFFFLFFFFFSRGCEITEADRKVKCWER